MFENLSYIDLVLCLSVSGILVSSAKLYSYKKSKNKSMSSLKDAVCSSLPFSWTEVSTINWKKVANNLGPVFKDNNCTGLVELCDKISSDGNDIDTNSKLIIALLECTIIEQKNVIGKDGIEVIVVRVRTTSLAK